MRIWISKNSEVPIREQLVTQIVLGIVSNDLKIAERLPSTRDGGVENSMPQNSAMELQNASRSVTDQRQSDS